MNREEIRRAAQARLEERRADGTKSVAVPEWGEDAALHFHLPPTLKEVQAAAELMQPFVAKDGQPNVTQADMDAVFNRLVFTLAKDADGERVWTDEADFEAEMDYPLLIRCVTEAGLMEALTEAVGGVKPKKA